MILVCSSPHLTRSLANHGAVIFILKALGLSPDMDFESVSVGYLESLEVDGHLIAKTAVGDIVGNGNANTFYMHN